MTQQGRLSQDMQILRTAWTNIQQGDNLRLDYDGRFYAVQAVGFEGTLRFALLDASQNQLNYEVSP